jgi:predicted RNA-binding Zn-ribbon protein involved in translation (DUF1610 family)
MGVNSNCRDCGTELTGGVTADGTLKPCPNCGSSQQVIIASTMMLATASMTASGTVTSYSERLLSLASSLMAQREYGVAIVVCHMGCEVATERAFDRASHPVECQNSANRTATLG